MKVCRTDAGNASFLRCSFHGWTYANDGTLTGVPYHKEGYGSVLDRDEWGLHEVPKLTSYGGFVFGCWDADAVSLDQYLGELRWYLDVMIERALGGLEVLSGQQRYVITANWKIAAENFVGDTLPRAVLARLGLQPRQAGDAPHQSGHVLCGRPPIPRGIRRRPRVVRRGAGGRALRDRSRAGE